MIGRIAVAAALLVSHPASAGRAPVESWGKPNVTFDAYREDAVACAKTGYFRDISADEPAKRFVAGWREADNQLNKSSIDGPGTGDWIQAVLRTQPDQKKRAIHAIQVGDVDRCLSDRGYRRFTLTRAQEKILKTFPHGSQSRHRYMHSLAAKVGQGQVRADPSR